MTTKWDGASEPAEDSRSEDCSCHEELMLKIDMVPIGNTDRATLEYLARAVGEDLGLSCNLRKETLSVHEAYDPQRQQYNSTRLLEQLLRLDGDPEAKLLGVADVDLFIPILTFVFGEAQLGQRAAVMSVHRLRQQFYGLPDDESLFLARCEKEAVHELGHTFGLVHCPRFQCVMHYSNSIEQVDLKSTAFCRECAGPVGQLKMKYRLAADDVLETAPAMLFGPGGVVQVTHSVGWSNTPKR